MAGFYLSGGPSLGEAAADVHAQRRVSPFRVARSCDRFPPWPVPVEKHRLTLVEFLHFEREADYKSEYYDGEMFAIAGGSPRHSLLGSNLLIALGLGLKGQRCRPYNSDLRIAVPDGLSTYPDISVFCEPMTFLPGTDDTATNPTVIVEVLSKSTEGYDRGRKFERYRRIASLRECILVSQEEPIVERFTRDTDGRWVLTEASGLGATLPIDALGIKLPLAEVYEEAEFPAKSTTGEQSGVS